MSVRVRFVSADGGRVSEVVAAAGSRLLDVAQADGQPLEGTCEGQMACSTCHVIVAPEDFDRLPRASAEEDDLLDLAAHVTRTSRLACQIWLDDALGSLTVRVPAEARDMAGAVARAGKWWEADGQLSAMGLMWHVVCMR